MDITYTNGEVPISGSDGGGGPWGPLGGAPNLFGDLGGAQPRGPPGLGARVGAPSPPQAENFGDSLVFKSTFLMNLSISGASQSS